MALISAKLSNLVPFSCAALFLYDEETETLRCRFATGVDAEIIQQIAVHTGEGLTGWVARNRRAARQRAAERRPRGGGPDRSSDEPAVGARLPAAVQRAVHRHAVGLSRRRRATTATITAGSSIASPSRRRRSSTTRCCSSRRRKTR